MNKIKKYLTSEELEQQENLSKELLDLQLDSDVAITEPRPKESYIDLMKWADKTFSHKLKGHNIKRFVHNKISIDGQFLQYCKEMGASVTSLYKESVVSWKTEFNFEKFFMQGVFLIKHKNLEFIHSALFHKGNSNEDEICFFILLDKNQYEGYVSFRNNFDTWAKNRERSNLEIKVVGGNDMPYTKDNSWDDLFLPANLKKDLSNLVSNFLESKSFYEEKKIPWKRGVLLYGFPGNGKTSIIKTIISEYNFKPVTICAGATNDDIKEAFVYAEQQSPSLLYFEDIDSLFENNIDVSSFLNLMDGISAKNGLFIVATANDIKKLKSNVTDRPSRFDKKFEIPLPDLEMTYIYLKKWFGNLLTPAKCKELSKISHEYLFSYAYLKELYLSSMFEALSNNRKAPTHKDIHCALNSLIKDKNILNSSNKSINTSKYFK